MGTSVSTSAKGRAPAPIGGALFIASAHLPGLIGLSKPTIRRLTARGEFPKPRRLGARAVAYLRSEIEAWAASRPISDVLPPPARPREMQP